MKIEELKNILKESFNCCEINVMFPIINGNRENKTTAYFKALTDEDELIYSSDIFIDEYFNIKSIWKIDIPNRNFDNFIENILKLEQL